jgi:hypothetical protein
MANEGTVVDLRLLPTYAVLGPFDVEQHTNTHDRALGIHIAPRHRRGGTSSRGSSCCSSRASMPAGRSSTLAPTRAATELGARTSTYVPALDKAAYNGGDDFLGSARARLFGFVNSQIGADNRTRRGSYTCSRTATLPRTLRRQQRADRRAAQRRSPADHRPRRRPVRVRWRGHQLRRDRLHRQAADQQPRGPRAQLAVPAALAPLETADPQAGSSASSCSPLEPGVARVSDAQIDELFTIIGLPRNTLHANFVTRWRERERENGSQPQARLPSLVTEIVVTRWCRIE